MYELTQDKLSIEIDQSLFSMVLSMIAESTSCSLQKQQQQQQQQRAERDDEATLLSDIMPSGSGCSSSTKASRSSSGCSSMTSSPVNSSHTTHQTAHTTAGATLERPHLDLDDNETDDLVVYKKIAAKCRKLFEKIAPLFGAAAVEANFTTPLLALDCLLNLNRNTRNLLYLNEAYKAELRVSGVLDKLACRVHFLADQCAAPAHHHTHHQQQQHTTSGDAVLAYVIDRLIACLGLYQTVTQPPVVMPGSVASTSASSASHGAPTKKLLSICHGNMPTPEYVLNQAYLIELKDGDLFDSLKR